MTEDELLTVTFDRFRRTAPAPRRTNQALREWFFGVDADDIGARFAQAYGPQDVETQRCHVMSLSSAMKLPFSEMVARATRTKGQRASSFEL